MDFQRRRLLAGRYQLLEELGSGGMGTVYRAMDRRTKQVVAVKVLHPFLRRDSDYLRRFQREAQVALAIDSRHAVQVLATGQEGDSHFLVMEYVHGTSLGNLLREGRPTQRQVLEIALQVARALEAAAARGIIHRDIKPDNILIESGGNVKVADFGIAKATELTSLGTVNVMGTLRYMAPEAFKGDVDPRSDIYSLGIVMYELVAGQVPFQATTAAEAMRQHLEETPRPVRQLAPQVRPEVASLIERCLAKNPRDRPQSAREVRQAIEALVPDIQEPAGVEPQTVRADQAHQRRQQAGSTQDDSDARTQTRNAGPRAERRPTRPLAAGEWPFRVVAASAVLVLALLVAGAGVYFFDNRRGESGNSTESGAPTLPTSQNLAVRSETQSPSPTVTGLSGSRLATATPGGVQPVGLPPCRPADAGTLASTKGNLILNPSAEDGSQGWRMVTYAAVILPPTIDSSVAHSGGCSLRLDRQINGACLSTCGYWTEPLTVDPSRTYRLSLWIRGSPSLSGRASLNVISRALDQQGNTVSRGGTVFGITDDWKEFSISAARFTTSSVILEFNWVGSPQVDGAEGQIWIDDVYLASN